MVIFDVLAAIAVGFFYALTAVLTFFRVQFG